MKKKINYKLCILALIAISVSTSCFNDEKVNCHLKWEKTILDHFENPIYGWGYIKTNQNPNYVTALINERFCPYALDSVNNIRYIHRDFVPRSNICNDTVWFPLSGVFVQ
jgi:hypothetical protein